MTPSTVSVHASPFREGVIATLPICVSFLFLFFSLGSLATTSGYNLAQSMGLTAIVYASPMQAWILQAGKALTIPTLVVSALLINFRFIILSSVLAARMRSVPLWKLLLSVVTMSASSFAVASPHREQSDQAFFRYNLGVGVASYGTALAATLAGSLVAATPSARVAQIVAMILPIHFTTLIGSNWPKLKPIAIAATAFVAAPIAGRLIGEMQAIVMPFVLGAFFVVLDEFGGAGRKAKKAPGAQPARETRS
jgi:predicted branched-subunit amino acid permease